MRFSPPALLRRPIAVNFHLKRAAALGGLALLAATCVPVLGLSGCGRTSPRGGSGPGGDELVILASSGLQDLEFLHKPMEVAIGHRIRFDYVGTVELADRIRNSGASAADFAWPASGFYLRLAAPSRVTASEKIMLSPVVFALKQSRAEDLGWDKKPPGWGELARAVSHENLALGMTSPIVSDLGLAALFSAGMATAHDVQGQQQIDLPALKKLFSGTRLIGGSAHWLADAYLKQENRLDGMVNYEAVVLSLNAGGQLGTPLAAIHPRDGSVVADYPLMLVNPARKLEFAKLTAYLRSPAVQQQIVNRTWRRPVTEGIKLPPQLAQKEPHAVAEPTQQSFVDTTLDAYQTQVRPPPHSYFVLDVSGSMAQEHRMDELQAALRLLCGSDKTTLAGRYASFLPREKVDFTTFDSHVLDHLAVDFATAPGYEVNRQHVEDFIAGLQPHGGTAIYDAVQSAYQQAVIDRKKQPGYYPSIVLMTDGESSSGSSFEQFRDWYQALPDTAQDIPVFTILFGDGDLDEMKSLADLTGGRVFDATHSSLSAVFKDIRGYQ